MNILVFNDHYLPGYKAGGPIKTIKNLFNQLGTEMSFDMITSDRDLGSSVPYKDIDYGTWVKVGNANVFYIKEGIAGYSQIIRIFFRKRYDIVYLNSFFSMRFSFIPFLIAKIFRMQIILGPRGEFSEGALNLKPIKKSCFIFLYKILGFHRNLVFQASSEYEAKDIRKLLGSNISIQIVEDIGGQEFVESLPLKDEGILKAIFVSRISPMKNLLIALEMLQSVKQSVFYHIYGPIEDYRYWAKCEELINLLPINIQVEYKGELKPDKVVKTMSAYDVFFMPTKGENYGHAIAEALCAGLPVLISDTTPWRNLQEQGIGWDLPLNKPELFSHTIRQLSKMPPNAHHEMRKKVLFWAKNKFSQRDAIEAHIDMFRLTTGKNR